MHTKTCFFKFCVKMIDCSSKSMWGPGPLVFRLWIWMCDMPPLKWVLCNFCLIKYSQEAAEPAWIPFWSPNHKSGSENKHRRSIWVPVKYWVEGALLLLSNKLCLKIIDHVSRMTWDSDSSRSRLRVWKCDPPSLKQGHSTTCVQ